MDLQQSGFPTLSSIWIDDTSTRCRWLRNARAMVVTPTRTVWVVSEGSGFRCRSFAYSKPGSVQQRGSDLTSSPTVPIGRGRIVSANANHQRFEFEAGPWTYRLDASAANTPPGASLSVLRHGQVVQTTTAAAYELAAQRIEQHGSQICFARAFLPVALCPEWL